MELNVGDYVRINNNFNIIFIGIGKIIKIDQDTIYIDMKSNLPISVNIEDIANHSKDIIDLIEVGDYVNGYKIIALQKKPTMAFCEQSYKDGRYAFANDDIKSILTHEQFDNMKYEVK